MAGYLIFLAGVLAFPFVCPWIPCDIYVFALDCFYSRCINIRNYSPVIKPLLKAQMFSYSNKAVIRTWIPRDGPISDNTFI